MGIRGRRSTASLTVVGRVVELIPRPSAPSELTDEQADEWRTVVDRLPADWFPVETHGLLVQYCRHRVAARRVAQLVADFEKRETLDLDEYDQLLKMQEREGRALSSLATRMRLSQQTTYDPRKKKPPAPKRPWDDAQA